MIFPSIPVFFMLVNGDLLDPEDLPLNHGILAIISIMNHND